MLMIAAAIMLIIYTTSAAMLSPKSPQSIHKMPDAIHNLPLNLCVAFQFSSSIKDHTTLIPMVLFCFTFGK